MYIGLLVPYTNQKFQVFCILEDGNSNFSFMKYSQKIYSLLDIRLYSYMYGKLPGPQLMKHFVNKILQIAAIIIQTEFILHMKNITFRRRHVHVKYFRANRIFLCIFVMNILRWLVDSTFMKHKTNASFTQRQFYGELYWDTIDYTLFPVNVFYKFLQSMEMNEFYRNTYPF